MNLVAGLLITAAVIAAAVVLVGFVGSRTVVRHNAARAAASLPPATPGDLEESAAMLEPERGFGVLRLTDQELIFANGRTGAVTRFARADLATVAPSQEVGGAGAALRRPALVVTTTQGAGMAIAVDDVATWLATLNDQP